MVSFFVIDMIFLVVFSTWVTWFLYKRKAKLDREGIMFLYRTQLGVKFIEAFSKKNGKFLKAIVPLVIGLGYVLMGVMIWMLYQSASLYVTTPDITDTISAPPIAPLIPYFPQIFGMESFFPPFYFTYFILALLIVAVVHEFSHGIFMKTFKMKIKSTGFAFLGPVLGAFVEQDQKDFEKKSIKEQLAVLAAGVFANIVFALLFFGILMAFLNVSYTQSEKTIVQGYHLLGYSDAGEVNENFLNDLETAGQNIVLQEINNDSYYIRNDTESQVLGVIKSIESDAIKKNEDITRILQDKGAGETVEVEILIGEDLKTYDFILSQHPGEDRVILGVAGTVLELDLNLKQKVLLFFAGKEDPTKTYEPKFETADFFYNLFWWIMVINFLVALFNMLPVGILDGGRFFYLTILAITRREKVAKGFYKGAGYVILAMFVAMMVFWAISLAR